jgi:hypothetical protein
MRALTHILLIGILFALPVQAVFWPIGWGPASKTQINDQSHSIFPSLKGMNLEGDDFLLPQDLAGELNIVVIAFKRKQQDDVNTWLEALANYVSKTEDLELYELPTMKKFNILMRLNINNGMRYGIASKESRENTISLYIDKASFKSRLEIANEDNIQTLLINKQGKILWRTSGIADQSKIASLKEKTELLQQKAF